MEFTEEQWARFEKAFGLPRARLQTSIEILDGLDHSEPGLWRDRKGWPISLGQAVLLAADDEYRRVGLTEIASVGVVVSTVWMGWAHGPELFETAVFLPGNEGTPLQSVRYGSEFDARAGHDEVVTAWSSGGGRCPECSALEVPHHKFNNGNPVTVWFSECDCREAREEVEVEAFIDGLTHRVRTQHP